MKFKRILCPTDFSEAAFKALKVGIELARDYSAELLVINVCEALPVYPIADTVPPAYLDQYLADAKKAAQGQMNNLVKKIPVNKIKLKVLTESGLPATRIVDLAEEKKVDLIVIATHGQSGWRRFLFGSVTERVIRSTSKPVLIIQVQPREEDR